MSKVKSVQSIYFSPTGGTRKIVTRIFDHIDLKKTPEIDLTLTAKRKAFKGKLEGDLVLVGSPTYAGAIPWPFHESLQTLEGDGKWAVPIAVYGNRSPDTIIEELSKLLRGRGFKILAAATFVALHSLSNIDHPMGVGRPDEKDMLAAERFGEELGRKAKSPGEIPVSGLLLSYPWGLSTGLEVAVPYDQVSNPMVESYPEGYHKRVLARVKRVWWASSSDVGACNMCLSCVNSCPTGALEGGTLRIDDERCIRCMACVRVCPSGVMRLVVDDKPATVEGLRKHDKLFEVRKEPRIFL